MTYKQRQLRRFKERVERFQHLLELKAPSTVLIMEGSLIIRAVLGIVGGDALAEVGNTLVGNERELMGICRYHEDEDRPIVLSGLCADCLLEAGIDTEVDPCGSGDGC